MGAVLSGAGCLWCLTGIFAVPRVEAAWVQRVLEVVWASPAKALAVGIVLALAGLVRTGTGSKNAAKYLMQTSIVLSGLTMNVAEVLKAGLAGIAFTIATIAGSFGLGWVLWKWLKTDGKVTTLLSSGTAICGGSAIAAVSPVIMASGAQISVAMATVFILNGVGLYVFPPLGEWLGLSSQQFGTWAGIAIHDTSSVYGAGQAFDRIHPGGDALQQAMAVKLSRALWIAPIVFVAAWWMRRVASREGVAARTPFPWFILWFIAACAARSVWPGVGEYKDEVRRLAGTGMTMALLLIGMGLSREAIRTVGFRPMLQGVMLWVVLGGVSLLAVMRMGG
ncbi:MAG: putative sulfate exporter family transporter [Phycisphaerales bacterium]|nr:putative sulfate exporter family transporter [Phycisphaerales bacterium]